MSPLALLLLFQTPCDLVLVDSAGDQLARLAELDGVPGTTSVHEATALWEAPSPLTPRAFDAAAGPGGLAAYWADSTRDRLYRAVDVNANGELEPFETVVWRDSKKLDGSSRARGLVALPDGSVWWCSDRNRRGLFRCADLDGDGVARDPGELAALTDGTPAGHLVETDVGPVAVGTDGLLGLARDGNAVVAYQAGAEEALLRFEDLDGDGAVDGPGESRLFLNASGKHPLLPWNADWEARRLRSLLIPNASGPPFYGRLRHVAVERTGGRSVWYFGCDSHASSKFGTNQFFHGLSGLIFRGEDRNGDGDLQDEGEVALFFDGSATTYPVLPVDQILGLDACGGELHVLYLRNNVQRVRSLVDRNGDGDAHDPGELSPPRFDADAFGGALPFAQEPLVRDFVALPPGALAEPNALFARSGKGCSLMVGPAPTLHGVGRARLGTSGFTCELRGALGGTEAYLYLSDGRLPIWAQHLLPYELSLYGLPGCTLYVPPLRLYRALTDGAPGVPLDGGAAVRFDIPDDPSLAGEEFHLQWVVRDVYGVPSTQSPGVALTGMGTIVVEP